METVEAYQDLIYLRELCNEHGLDVAGTAIWRESDVKAFTREDPEITITIWNFNSARFSAWRNNGT